ncbi:alpha/beta-type small acid-soluble spore protein [Rossellomorea marisflavi]|uniref:alpha/beta-type small acid-soluble spore protein n=1 Tax=Rossellomorea marisflavi TaxID=189381 RepID=UPI00064FE536|nr:alpha/beta-type small acid-soluble spore protein [Rossellomorea marisflavi]KML08032.1 alpha/beta hydrolase [Rossellomorea marisflavi]
MSKRKLLVPGSRGALNEMKARISGADRPSDAKFEAAREVGVPLQKGYNGHLSAAENGRVGGQLGGKMVQELIKIAKEEMDRN